ncbi:hypothetical protein GKQ23_21990 [Erwinia sp. E602]|uniref:exopolysaccharide production protein YjbE n=1 Tax=unclassified Erwinia TaxID=2622719 RepID=UPI00092EEA57|nr:MULTISPECIES: exopolysaccharide production protein YjbE [unclassified Erwinia]QUG77501.1 hypothetical protein GKQ23_21990 [Erwinia sp. E602]
MKKLLWAAAASVYLVGASAAFAAPGDAAGVEAGALSSGAATAIGVGVVAVVAGVAVGAAGGSNGSNTGTTTTTTTSTTR